MPEEWRPVVGFEGLYEVSDLGRVRSLPRVAYRANSTVLNFKGALKKSNLMSAGYHHVTITRDGVSSQRLVHVLVAEAFLPNPDGLPEVNHLNLDQLANVPSNLEWSSHQRNIAHARDHGRLHGFTNKRRRCKLQPDQVRTIRARALSGEKHETIAADYSVSRRMISMIANGDRWNESFDGRPDVTKPEPVQPASDGITDSRST